MAVTSEIVSFISGVVTALFTNLLWDQRRRVRAFIDRRGMTKPDVLGFESSSVGLYPINRWSLNRPLERHRLSMHVVTTRPVSRWAESAEWQQAAQELGWLHSGDIAYLVDFSIDHREGEHGERFHYSVAPCSYSEHLATFRFLDGHPEIREEIRAAFDAGRTVEFARNSPPSLIKVNVAVVSRDDQFLVVQRSGAVQHKKGVWTVGPNETMALDPRPVPAAAQDDLFGLAERCLDEELGLAQPDYAKICISWIGYEVSSVSVKVFAQVRARLSASEIIERMTYAHSLYETQNVEWRPFSRKALTRIVRDAQRSTDGRIWSSSAPLAAQELWRMRDILRPDAD